MRDFKMLRNVKIAHFISDEKFPDYAFKQFEHVLPGGNDYFIPVKIKPLKNVKEIPVKRISKIAFKNPFFMRHLKTYNFVILHALTRFNRELVSHAQGIKFVWIGMGHDYYDLIYKDPLSLYLPKTKVLFKRFDTKYNAKLTFKQFMINLICKNYPKSALLPKIHYFAPVFRNEYDIIAQKMDGFNPKYIWWNYASNTTLVQNNTQLVNRNAANILLGNSASIRNNHVEAIDLIKKITNNKKTKRVICPLSYGNRKYADFIEDYGRKNLGSTFNALRSFMPYSEYMELIRGCSNLIMNHLRQEGAGNISAMLFRGAKVFLNKSNPHYEFLNKAGITIFSIDDLQNDPSLLDKKLSHSDIDKNQSILRSRISWETAIKKTENLISTLLSE